MNFSKDDASIIGLVLTWIVGIFGGGYTWGRMTSRVTSVEQQNTDLKEILFTPDGEFRYVSVIVCGDNQEGCRKLLGERHEMYKDLLEKQDKKLDLIIDHMIKKK